MSSRFWPLQIDHDARITNLTDLVLRGPHVVDPSQGLSEVLDVAGRAGTVAALGHSLAVPPGTPEKDLNGAYISS